MKIYLSLKDPEDSGFNHFGNIAHFSRGVMENEATEIVCDNFLSSFEYENAPKILEMLKNKMRIGCQLTIIEPDFYLVSKHVFREEKGMKEINDAIFRSGALKCFLTLELIESLTIAHGLQTGSKHFDEDSCRFVLKVGRQQ